MSAEHATDLVLGVALGFEEPISVWRDVWKKSKAARDEIRGWTKFAHVKKIVAQLEAEDAAANAGMAIEKMMSKQGA